VKTVVFSELPKNEKMKYFNFLLENEINFTRDENGFYVALVKVLNPQFYGEQQDRRNSKLPKGDEGLQNKPRSSSQTAGGTKKPVNKQNSFKTPGKSPGKFEKGEEKGVRRQLQNYSEMFNDKYKRFFKTLNPLVGVRGKKLNIYQLKYNIEEIYSIRFIKDTSDLKNQLTNKNKTEGGEIDVKDPFPVFVVEFLTNKFVKKPIIDQHALDLLLSLDYFRSKHKEIEIFSKFLNEEYDSDDLIFFLFVRSCIEKEMKVMFIEKSRDEINIQYQEEREETDTDLYLNIKVCLKSIYLNNF
jgi:hypothetical protein